MNIFLFIRKFKYIIFMEGRKFHTSLFALLVICSLAASVQASPGSMTRTITPSVVQPGGEVTVTLDVKVSAGERYYLIDETPPPALSIMDTGELIKDTQDHLKIVQLQNAVDKSYTYTLKAPEAEGEYGFSGIYQIDGMEQPADVAGTSTLTVSSSPAGMDPITLVVVVVIAIVVIVAFLFLKKSKTVKV